MRDQRTGTIVNITSMGGKIYTPLGGWYHATMFTLEALSDCLRLEVKPFGINVVVIEPGGIRTKWPGIAADKLRQAASGSPYANQDAGTARPVTPSPHSKSSGSDSVPVNFEDPDLNLRPLGYE